MKVRRQMRPGAVRRHTYGTVELSEYTSLWWCGFIRETATFSLLGRESCFQDGPANEEEV